MQMHVRRFLEHLHYSHQFCFPGTCSSIFNPIRVCINITYINFHDIIQDRYAIKSVTLAWAGYPYREHIYLSIVCYILSLFMVSRMTACFVKILQLAEQFRMYGCKCKKSPQIMAVWKCSIENGNTCTEHSHIVGKKKIIYITLFWQTPFDYRSMGQRWIVICKAMVDLYMKQAWIVAYHTYRCCYF